MTRVKSLAGLPIEQYSSPNIGGTMSAHRGSVLHIAEGTYRGTISWQMNPDQRYADGTKVTTSSTWIVGKNRGEWAQMVDTDRVAWCQRSGSLTRNSIELAGHAPDAPTAWQVEACAQIFAWEHQHYSVPLQVANTDAVLGLCHHSADREWAGVEWGHESCPGSGVIRVKAAIVARAKQIINPPPEDDMLTAPQAKQLADIHWALTHIPDPAGSGVNTPHQIAMARIDVEIDAIMAKLGVDLTAVRQKVDQLSVGLDPAQVAREVLAALPRDLAKQIVAEFAAELNDDPAGS